MGVCTWENRKQTRKPDHPRGRTADQQFSLTLQQDLETQHRPPLVSVS
jgi:hypothetical protein